MRSVLTLLAAPSLLLCAQAAPSRDDVVAAMKKAADFYVNRVSTQGGYHFAYAEDLSYGRSEQSEGPTQVETQRDGTPLAGMAFLDAYEATGDAAFLDAARKAALALVKGQLCSGGWDYVIEFDPELRPPYGYRADGDCSKAGKRPTTLDDNVTQACVRLLMRVDRALGFKDGAIHESVLFALESLLKAQYPNGAWPQRFSAFPDPAAHPVLKASYPKTWPRKWPGTDYQKHYTFNDGSINDAIDMMLEANVIYKDARYLASAERGGDFILLAQMPEPQPAWAQQYDAAMQPAWARLFEPPSVTGGESLGILRTLLVLYAETGKRKYLDAAPRALTYLEGSVLPPVEKPSEARRKFAPGEPVLARFYELETNKPLYITKGTQLAAKGLGSARIDGYELSYSDASVITHYAVLVSGSGLAAIRKEYERLAAADPSTIRRPEKLSGLSPWTRTSHTTSRPSTSRVRQIIGGLDPRGAWIEEGTIGKSDRVVSVQAAREMVMTVNGTPQPVRENDHVEIFDGSKPPRQRIIRTATFARNLGTLTAYLK